MTNPYYNSGSFPATGSPATSASMRAELALIAAGFEKLPALSTNANLLVSVNETGTALVAGDDVLRVDFDVAGTSSAVGRMKWNDTDGTLDLGLKGGSVVLQIGQEEVLRVYNNTGSAMVDGQAVYINSSSGSRPTIALAQANSEGTSSKVLGIMSEHVSNNAEGFCTTHGLVSNFDTSYLTEGAVVWLSAATAGGLTTTKPTPPNHSVMIGYCIRSHGTQGILYVKVQNGYELDELHDVLISGIANNNMLRYNASSSVWQNIAGPAGAVVGTTDTQTLTNKTMTTPVINGFSGTGNGYITGDLAVTGALSATGGVTLSGGTANGVAYLNGSKVLTSGSALTFDGTSFAINGGTGASGNVLGVATADNPAAGRDFIRFIRTGVGTAGSIEYSEANSIGVNATTATLFKIGGSEQMRLTSTGLGIGTSSPQTKLHVYGTGSQEVRVSTITSGNPKIQLNAEGINGGSITYDRATSLLQFENGGATSLYLNTSGNLGIGTSSPAYKLDVNGAINTSDVVRLTYVDGTNSYYLQNPGASGAANAGLAFVQAGVAERMRIDSSGNLGLGVTPSAWSGGNTAIQIGNSSHIAGVSALTIAANYYYNSADKYYGSGAATKYIQAAGVHSWYTAPSGTAGNAITFTQAMTLDASGNLAIGATTSSGMRLGVTGYSPELYDPTTFSAKFAYVPKGSQELFSADTGLTAKAGYANLINIAVNDSTGGDGVYLGAVAQSTGNSAANFVFGRRTGAQTWAESMRLDNSGNLGLGVTPSAWGGSYTGAFQMKLGGGIANNNANDVHVFNNCYYNGTNWVYISTNLATRFEQFNGGHYWFTAPSGTAGDAITFTQAMTLDASGNLMVGTTTNTNNSKLVVQGSGTMNDSYFTRSFNYTDVGSSAWGLWRIQTLTGGGGRIDLSEYGTDAATPNAAQYTITFYVNTSGAVGAVSTKLGSATTNTVLLVTSGGYLYLAVNKGHANGAGYWNLSFTGSSYGADFTFSHASSLTGYTTVYTV